MNEYSALTVFLGFLVVIFGLLALFMPVFVYQIKNRCAAMDKKMAAIIKLLGGLDGNIKG